LATACCEEEGKIWALGRSNNQETALLVPWGVSAIKKQHVLPLGRFNH